MFEGRMFDCAKAKAIRESKPRLFIKARRKDGKIAVTFVNPFSGRKFNKILTAEKLHEEINSGRYDVID